MKIIRDGVFETNSSSTHALVIPHKVDEEHYDLYDSLDHDYGFGRCESRLVESWDEKLAYVYYVLKDFLDWNSVSEDNDRKGMVTAESITEFETKINNIYTSMVDSGKFNIYPDSEPTPQDIFDLINDNSTERTKSIFPRGMWNWVGVDHTEDFATNGFVTRMLEADEEFLKRFIFNRDSYITVGGDEYRGYNIKTIGFEYDYESGDHMMNEKGELPPKEWLNERGCIKDEYWDRYWNEYTLETGEFWDKLREYEKENDVYLKGN